MNDKHFQVICQKIDKVAALIAIQNVDNKDKKIKILKGLGLPSNDIGALLGVDGSVVRRSKEWKK